jgi:hypothetical protein
MQVCQHILDHLADLVAVQEQGLLGILNLKNMNIT